MVAARLFATHRLSARLRPMLSRKQHSDPELLAVDEACAIQVCGVSNDPRQPTFFSTAAKFRRWLKTHHAKQSEQWVGFYRKSSGRPSLTWPESVDEALCFGWIDGLRKGIDAQSYMIRFTPRRPISVWSAVNARRMEELIRQGRVHQAGADAYAKRIAAKSG